MSSSPHPRENCYFCGEGTREILETHHVVPRRFDGSDDDENLVDVCPTCHEKLEKLYGPRFYEQLAIYRRSGQTPDGQRIPDSSAHFWVSYDEEGYRQYTCKLCAQRDDESVTSGLQDTVGTGGGPAFFDQEEAIEHLEEEHDEDPRAAKQPPRHQTPSLPDDPPGPPSTR